MIKFSKDTLEDDRGAIHPIPLDILDRNWNQCTIATNPKKHTFRGLHYQEPRQAKYIRVIQGAVIDFSYSLNGDPSSSEVLLPGQSVYIKENYAHGYLTLEPSTIVMYLSTEVYSSDQKVINYKSCNYIKHVIENLTGGELLMSGKDGNG